MFTRTSREAWSERLLLKVSICSSIGCAAGGFIGVWWPVGEPRNREKTKIIVFSQFAARFRGSVAGHQTPTKPSATQASSSNLYRIKTSNARIQSLCESKTDIGFVPIKTSIVCLQISGLRLGELFPTQRDKFKKKILLGSGNWLTSVLKT